MKEMENKVAIITGATSGIGYETALLFAEHKINVIAAGRDEKNGKKLVDEIASKEGQAIFIKTDMTDAKSIKNLVDATMHHFGRLDIAFNNAGIEGISQTIVDMEEDNWDKVVNTNLKGVWLCLKYEIPAIISSGGGAIVNTSTSLTRMGLTKAGAYTASKAGVDALTQVAAIEYGTKGIRVNSINPGAVYTPMLQRLYNQEQIKKIEDTNPLVKIASPRDIAQTVLWLCSPLANHINGTCIFIDGGAVNI